MYLKCLLCYQCREKGDKEEEGDGGRGADEGAALASCKLYISSFAFVDTIIVVIFLEHLLATFTLFALPMLSLSLSLSISLLFSLDLCQSHSLCLPSV